MFKKKGGKSRDAEILESLDRDPLDVGANCRIEDFEQLEVIGSGTFAHVRLCKHKASGQHFALKVQRKHDVIRLKQVEHVLSEKKVLEAMDHPFIVRMPAAFQDSRNLYMVLELVIGGEVFSHLRKAGRFSNETSRIYAAQIVLVICHLHEHNVVYRDLKPENLLLDEKGFLKITDFGFAKEVTERTWTLCGTPEYLAPEIIQSKGHGKAVDWWALGVLIFEMLAGYPPFYDESQFQIYQKILLGKVEYPRHFDSNAKDLIRKLLQPDRCKRLGNLRGGADDIRKHKWFKGLNWEAILRCEIQPPIVPELRHGTDTRNFEQFPDFEDEPASAPFNVDERALEMLESF